MNASVFMLKNLPDQMVPFKKEGRYSERNYFSWDAIRYIKDVLGHFDIKTTERYTPVSRRLLVNISSPLDDLFARGII